MRYQTGKFLNAMNQECAERNEQNIVTVRGEGMEIVFKQIAGLIARRIVFNHREGDRVERGQRVGLIKFGSRTDVILPGEAEIRVKTGQRVKGGSSIIAEMPESETHGGSEDATKSRQREREAGDGRRRGRLNSADAALAKARNSARMRRGMFMLPSFFTAMNIGAGYFAITQTIDAATSNRRRSVAYASGLGSDRDPACDSIRLARWPHCAHDEYGQRFRPGTGFAGGRDHVRSGAESAGVCVGFPLSAGHDQSGVAARI